MELAQMTSQSEGFSFADVISGKRSLKLGEEGGEGTSTTTVVIIVVIVIVVIIVSACICCYCCICCAVSEAQK